MFGRADTLHGLMKQAEQDLLEELYKDNGSKTINGTVKRHKRAYNRFRYFYDKWEQEEIIIECTLNKVTEKRAELAYKT